MIFNIRGDGSYLGLIDVGTYQGFVGLDWAKNPKALEPHFIEQMQNYSALFWDSNLESNWVVEVKTVSDGDSGFREVSGSIKVTGGRLAILEYDSLTTLAQFEKHTLEEQIKDNFITLENGNYLVKIIQKFDPSTNFPDGTTTDFIIEIIKSDEVLPPWQEVPWSTLK